MNTLYVIMNQGDVTQTHVDNAHQTRLNTIRYSLDGTRGILKFSQSDVPGIFIDMQSYNHSEILNLINVIEKDLWNEQEV